MIVESRSMESVEEEEQLGLESEDENSELSDSEVQCCHANISLQELIKAAVQSTNLTTFVVNISRS